MNCPKCGCPRYREGKLVHATLEPVLNGRPGAHMLMAPLDGPRSRIRARASENGWCAEVMEHEGPETAGGVPLELLQGGQEAR